MLFFASLAKKKIQKGKKLSRLAFFRCVSASDKCGKGRQTDRQVSPSTWVQFTLSEMSAMCSEPQVASCIWLDICLSDSRCVEGREATSPCCSYHNNYMAETMGTKCAGGTTSNNDIKQWHSAIVAPTTSRPPAPSLLYSTPSFGIVVCKLNNSQLHFRFASASTILFRICWLLCSG